jgi:hypothetical protein
MSSQKLSNQYLMTFSSDINNMKNRAKKINIFPNSKPTFLNGSKISKMMKTFNDESLHKKCITSRNSFFDIVEINKINNKKVKHIYVKKNNDKDFYERNENKENINLNSQNHFKKISNEIINENKCKKNVQCSPADHSRPYDRIGHDLFVHPHRLDTCGTAGNNT